MRSTFARCRWKSWRASLQPFFEKAGFNAPPEKVLAVTPLIRERIKLLRRRLSAADFFFVDELAPYDPAELIPLKKGETTGDAGAGAQGA